MKLATKNLKSLSKRNLKSSFKRAHQSSPLSKCCEIRPFSTFVAKKSTVLTPQTSSFLQKNLFQSKIIQSNTSLPPSTHLRATTHSARRSSNKATPTLAFSIQKNPVLNFRKLPFRRTLIIDSARQLSTQASDDDTGRMDFTGSKWQAEEKRKFWEYNREHLGKMSPMERKMTRAIQSTDVTTVYSTYQKLLSNGDKQTIYVYDCLILSAALTGEPERALQYLIKMKKDGIQPTVDHYNYAIRACWKERVDFAFSIFNVMQKDTKPNVATFKYLIKCCGRAKDLDRAFEQLDLMRRVHGILPTREIFICLLDACLFNKDSSRALQMIEEMDRRALVYDNKTLFPILTSAIRNDDCYAILQILQRFVQDDVPCDEGVLIHVLSSAARKGEIPTASAAWKVLESQGIQPSILAWNALIYTYIKARDFRNGFMFLQRKLDAGFPNAQSVIDFIKRYTTLLPEYIDEAYYGLEEFSIKTGQPASLELINIILECCAQIGDLSRALETFQVIEPTFKQVPDIKSYNALLEASFRSKTESYSDKLITTIFEDRAIEPDSETCEIACRIFAQRRDLKRTLAFIKSMQESEDLPDPDIRHFSPICMREAREENYQFVESMLESLSHDGYDTRKLYHYVHRKRNEQ